MGGRTWALEKSSIYSNVYLLYVLKKSLTTLHFTILLHARGEIKNQWLVSPFIFLGKQK